MEILLILLTFFSLYFVRKNTIELKTTKNPINETNYILEPLLENYMEDKAQTNQVQTASE